MSALDGFYATWEKARDNFGKDTPKGGVEFDASANLQNLGAYVRAAAPGAAWTGDASQTYDAANTKHGETLEELASLDKRMGYYLDQSAQVVVQGRRDLEDVRDWVTSMASQIPLGQDGDLMRMALASEGLQKITDIVERSNGDLQQIANNMREDISKYNNIGAGKGAVNEPLPEYVADLLPDDVDGTPNELTSEEGRTDGESLEDAMLSPTQRERLLEAGNLDRAQLDALARGEKVNVGPERMAYLYQLSQSMNGMPPEKIRAISDKLPMDERMALAQGLALISNPNAQSGVPNTGGPTDKTRDNFVPAAGSLSNLPDSLQQELTRTDRVEVVAASSAQDGSQDPGYTRLHGVGALEDITAVFENAGEYASGSEATKAALDAAAQYTNASIDHRETSARFGFDVDPALLSDAHGDDPRSALADIFQSSSSDHLGIHDLATGEKSETFLRALTQEHWGEQYGRASDVLSWVDDDPASRIHGETASGLAHYLAEKAPVLGNLPGGGTFGENNGEMAQVAAQAISPYLDDLAGIAGGPDNGVENFKNSGKGDIVGMSDMFASLNQNHEAATLINAAGAAAYESILTENAANGMKPHDLLTAGRISEAMNLGAEQANLFERETARWEQAVREGKTEDFINNFLKTTGTIPGLSEVSAFGEVAVNVTGNDPTNPATINGGEMMQTLVETGGANTNPYKFDAAVMNGVIQAHPHLADDPRLQPLITDGLIDMSKVGDSRNNASSIINDWIAEVGPQYGFSREVLNDWGDATENGAQPDWTP
ncbi:hypothetical protein H7I41_29090 [Mycobacterium manitobense]|uniref:ESX-1 secretion-associated protein EspA/EspE-like domain-containing protein n=1 Tax=[Mycobacterium] manitobense TaxID=190147 RepID=A0A9X2YVK6_9MYCO|nr:EspA/EspE family type VII secretion system effector [[Mycobacterium] manitobense]MCV7173981.1 hypothetical protein [[Mycobacterium] manitobense]